VKLIIKNREKSSEFANHCAPAGKILIKHGFRRRPAPCACRKGGLPPARRHAWWRRPAFHRQKQTPQI